MEHVDRLKLYMEHIGLPISQFADTAQIPRPTLSQILSGRNRKISNELLEKLHSAFPRLNVAWLLFGDGEMEINDIPQIVPQTSQPTETPKPQPSTHQQFTTSSLFGGLLNGSPAQPQAPTQPEPDQQSSAQQTFQSNKTPRPANPDNHISLAPDLSKKIQNIIVFYNDNSFEIFSPSQN